VSAASSRELHGSVDGQASADRVPTLRFAEICAVSFSLVAVVLFNHQLSAALGLVWQVALTVLFAVFPVAVTVRANTPSS